MNTKPCFVQPAWQEADLQRAADNQIEAHLSAARTIDADNVRHAREKHLDYWHVVNVALERVPASCAREAIRKQFEAFAPPHSPPTLYAPIVEREHRLRLARQDERKRARHHANAILYLAGHARRPGVDYEPTDAVKAADEHAFDLEAKRRTAAGGHVDVDCSECGRWNVADCRCTCTNRRVGWTRNSDFSFENPIAIHAEAY